VTFPYTAYRCGYPIRQISPSKPAGLFHADVGGAAPAPRNLHLTIEATPRRRRRAMEHRRRHASDRGPLGDAPGKLDKIARGFSFSYGVANRRGHEVHLCGLEPGARTTTTPGGKARTPSTR